MITLEITGRVLNKHNFKDKPWPEGSINIMRGTIYGNDWSHQIGTTAKFKVSSREEAVSRFEAYARERVKLDARFRQAILDCDGQTLMCCCHPRACHGDVILKLAREIATGTI